MIKNRRVTTLLHKSSALPRRGAVMLFLAVTAWACSEAPTQPTHDASPAAAASGVVNGIDTLTGLIAQGDYLLVKGNCLACHSAKLITQARATKAGWEEMIHWMQEKQGLQDLGDQHAPIVAYLTEHYAPEEGGRRAPLRGVEWYELTTENTE